MTARVSQKHGICECQKLPVDAEGHIRQHKWLNNACTASAKAEVRAARRNGYTSSSAVTRIADRSFICKTYTDDFRYQSKYITRRTGRIGNPHPGDIATEDPNVTLFVRHLPAIRLP